MPERLRVWSLDEVQSNAMSSKFSMLLLPRSRSVRFFIENKKLAWFSLLSDINNSCIVIIPVISCKFSIILFERFKNFKFTKGLIGKKSLI